MLRVGNTTDALMAERMKLLEQIVESADFEEREQLISLFKELPDPHLPSFDVQSVVLDMTELAEKWREMQMPGSMQTAEMVKNGWASLASEMLETLNLSLFGAAPQDTPSHMSPGGYLTPPPMERKGR